ncbi:uncharacterized protein LOC132119105 isoform X1 [Carassius carassius]|uniref:uncharacterized protein LOC132119105 isoform X1 n=2 Tax=Carassius carassius TaxID=217509 RepID=UPI002868C88C|nr:uncharacterized protein LOC132119105 isoform X1 [Carassius carassius]
MEGVLEVTLCLCVCKLMSSMLLCSSVVTHTITAVSLCCSCLLLFTDLAVTMFLLYVWLMESSLTPFHVSSDVIALRFLLFLCQAYGVVLLLMPPLIVVELFVELLYQDGRLKGQDARQRDANESLSMTVGYLGCLLAWSVSGIYSSHDWTLEQMSMETCREKGGHLLTCLPSTDEFSWVLPAMVVLLSLTGNLGLFRMKASRRQPDSSENTQTGEKKDCLGPGLMHMSQTLVDLEKTPNSCCVHMAGFVYGDPQWICPGNGVQCIQQTSLADSSKKQKQSSSHATFAQSKTDLLLDVTSLALKMEKCAFNKKDPKSQRRHSWFKKRESPCSGREIFTGLVCMVMVCVFPTVVSGNILLIFNLENLVVYSLKLLSLSVNRAPAL